MHEMFFFYSFIYQYQHVCVSVREQPPLVCACKRWLAQERTRQLHVLACEMNDTLKNSITIDIY